MTAAGSRMNSDEAESWNSSNLGEDEVLAWAASWLTDIVTNKRLQIAILEENAPDRARFCRCEFALKNSKAVLFKFLQ